MKNGGMASGRPGETERRRALNTRRLSHVKAGKRGLSVAGRNAWMRNSGYDFWNAIFPGS